MKKLCILFLLLFLMPLVVTAGADDCIDCDEDFYSEDFFSVKGWVEKVGVYEDRVFVFINDETDRERKDIQYVFYNVSFDVLYQLEEHEKFNHNVELFYKVVDDKCYLAFIEFSDLWWLYLFVVLAFVIGLVIGIIFSF